MLVPEIEVRGEENPDWGYARTLRSVLMVTSAEWVQSVYSSKFQLHGKEFIAPNRDYPYEGLLAYQDRENWKFVDCVAIGLRSEEDRRYLAFSEAPQNTVHIDPWEVTYHYRAMAGVNRDEEIPFSVSYRLFSACPADVATGRISVCFPTLDRLRSPRLRLLVQPFLDIRHMYGSSDFSRYKTESPIGACRQIQVTNEGRTVTFYCPSGAVNPFMGPETILWWYKFGTGERTERNDGQGAATTFLAEHHEIAAFFNLEFAITEQHSVATIFFSCSVAGRGPMFSVGDLRKLSTNSLRQEREQLSSIKRLVPNTTRSQFASSVLARVIGLTKFKIYIHPANGLEYVRVPYAGAWWFKTPWYRDVFEGILSSFRVFMSLDGERETVRQVLLLAYSQQEKCTGLIPNRMSEFNGITPTYNSVDSTLLFFITGHRYVQETRDIELARILLLAAAHTIRGLLRPAIEEPQEDGPPSVHLETGLILAAPHHSWIDTRSQSVDYAGLHFDKLPSRLSLTFVKDLYDTLGGNGLVQTLSSPAFFLPEINAQWIAALRGMLELIEIVIIDPRPDKSPTADELHELKVSLQCLLDRAKKNYLSTFWSESSGFLFNTVFRDLVSKDHMKCEAAITAAAMLGESVFSKDQLMRIWHRAARTLLIHRYSDGRPMAFGILTTRADRRIFYGDREYHGDVVWPRSTPYLVRLLEILEQKEVIKEILTSNLNHQMTEGAAFYNHEILARPCGKNLHPTESTRRNPVPVKNPIQFWSQWCDPFITFLKEEEHANSFTG